MTVARHGPYNFPYWGLYILLLRFDLTLIVILIEKNTKNPSIDIRIVLKSPKTLTLTKVEVFLSVKGIDVQGS